MRIFSVFFSLTLSLLFSFANAQQNYKYSVAEYPWNESLGNHRAVINVEKSSEVVSLKFEWRRHDADVAERSLIIINAETGDTVKNIQRIKVDNEVCDIKFGPVTKKGNYYFYYLPYQVQTGDGFYNKGYFPKENKPDRAWINSIEQIKRIPNAKIVEVQSRTDFDSFYPMEITATAKEEAEYCKKHKNNMLLFPEDRKFPIRMQDKLPLKWLEKKQGDSFIGKAQPNEYYVFQIGVWAPNSTLKEIKYSFSDLKGKGKSIPKQNITCFNTEGIDPYGKPFNKNIDVEKGKIQPLWFGIDIPTDQQKGEYKGTVEISDIHGNKQTIPVTINVSGMSLADRGDSEPWRHSRLRWLNSTLGIDEKPIDPYTPISIVDNEISVLGRTLLIDPTTGLPKQITASNKTILSSPLKIVIETKDGVKNIPLKIVDKKQNDGAVLFILKGADQDISIDCNATTEFDGWSNYQYRISAKKNIEIKDVRLEISMNNQTALYFMGVGLPGQKMPKKFDSKWDDKNSLLWPFDSFWMGNAHGGLHCELRGSSYSGPLLNLYRPEFPEAWYNKGKGGFTLEQKDNTTCMTVYSGERVLDEEKSLTFEFSTIITPVKQLNQYSQFTDRYYHNGGKPVPTENDMNAGVKIINVHHANDLNPVINYPFLTVDKMKQFVSEWHEKDCKVKIYYTIRELTNAVTEIWALRSLGDEILKKGDSGNFKTLGGYPWLSEHFVTDYTPQWYHHFENPEEIGITADASVLTATNDSRWYNYYIEGLAWLVKNVDIDGIYLDDVAYDRRILKRMRRAMDGVKKGCIIDLHSNTGFSRGPATQYTEFFPYIDKLWFGESFRYSQMSPENWLVEVSGIPFGLMGDMLHGGGNRWLGMQYGMTVRPPWLTEGVMIDPRPIWKIWDEFGIADSKMIGFWEENIPISSDNPDVQITSYVKGDSVLISIGNYSDELQEISLKIDWNGLGINPQNARLIAPEIDDFQPGISIKPSDMIRVEPRKGWLFYLIDKK
ncbi:MAG: DUF6067 family protein [Fermentimonas sp.]|nr:DUF6067 family protein [Fermentimonas sp.]